MYATPSIQPVPLDAHAASCCTVTIYSKELGVFLPVPNPACGPVASQFPTCGRTEIPALQEVGPLIPPPLQPLAGQVVATLNQVNDAIANAGQRVCVVGLAIPETGTGVIVSGL